MPPVKRESVALSEASLGIPLISRHRMGEPIIHFGDNDIRLGAIALEGSINETVEVSRAQTTYFKLLYNLETYIDDKDEGLSGSMLREQQQDVLHDIYRFMTESAVDEPRGSRGLIKLPTGSGKTAIIATLVGALSKPVNGYDEKPKALVLVPKLDLVSQTIGNNGVRGFAQFGTDTKVSEYTSQSKDLSGDAVVMTYQSLINAVREGTVTPDSFDYVICDEVHRALGGLTSSAVEAVSKNKLTLGLTATTEYAKQSVSEMFPEKIHSMELKEAIELGILSSVRGYAIASDEKIKKLSSDSNLTYEEIAPLIESKWRNAKAVEFAKSFVERGQQGIVACIPGGELRHAHEMAKRLSEALIVDPNSSDVRRMRAVAVIGSPEQRQAIYEAYEHGDIDVLTYVDVLTEGWDSEQAKFLINLRPTTSPVNAVQRLGRILRRTNPDRTATVIEFVDKSEKSLYTFFHAMGEETIEQGKVHGRQGSANRPGEPGDTLGEENELHLPLEIEELLAEVNHLYIRELEVTGTIKQAPDDITSIYSLIQQLGISRERLEAIVQELWTQGSIEPKIYRFKTKDTFGLTESEVQIVLNHPEITERLQQTGDIISIPELAKRLDVADTTVYKLIEQHEIPTTTFYQNRDKRGVRRVTGLTPEGCELLLQLPYFQIEEATDGVTSLSDIAERFGISWPTVKQYTQAAIEAGLINPRQYRFSTHGRGMGLTTEELNILLENPDFLKITTVESAPEDVVSVSVFAAEYGVDRGVVLENIKQLAESGIVLKEYKFANNRLSVGISQQDREIIQFQSGFEFMTAERPPEGVLTISALAKHIGVQFTTLRKYVEAEAENLGVKRYLYQGNEVIGLDEQQQEEIKSSKFVSDIINTPRAGDDVASVNSLATKLQVAPKTLLKAISQLEEEGEVFGVYYFGSRRVTGITAEQSTKLRQILGK